MSPHAPLPGGAPRGKSDRAQEERARIRHRIVDESLVGGSGFTPDDGAAVLTTLPPEAADPRAETEAAVDAMTVADRTLLELRADEARKPQLPYDPLGLDVDCFRTVSDTRDMGMDNWGASFPRPLPAAGVDRGWYDRKVF